MPYVCNGRVTALALSLLLPLGAAHAVGKWIPVKTPPPYAAYGAQILLSDGSVFFKTSHGGDNYGNQWIRYLPDSHGNYVNGTWSTAVPPMLNTRIDFSSQMLKDGRVYVAGGEYGTGGSGVEVYDPVANTWASIPWTNGKILDANLEILEDGRVLQSVVGSGTAVYLFDPLRNAFTKGASLVNGRYGESNWVKLPDGSILVVNTGSTSSERYIPSLSKWVADAKVPVSLFDPFGTETGSAFLLPNGKAIFFGSQGPVAVYTPSGGDTPGSWKAATSIPNGYGQPDAVGFMLADGKILLAVSPPPTAANHFPSPMYYYEYDYLTDSYAQANAPGGGLSTNSPPYVTQGVDLPDGTIMYTQQVSSRVYIYVPEGAPLEIGKPKIDKVAVKTACKEYLLTGTLFNGISEGANYGDDVQMNTNYPIAKLTAADGSAHYARTHDWNSTGVQRFAGPDTVAMTLPAGLPADIYDLTVSANGIGSAPVKLNTSCVVAARGPAGKGPAGLSSLRVASGGSGMRLSFHWQPDAGAGSLRVRVLRADGALLREVRAAPGDGAMEIPPAAGRDVYFVQWDDGALRGVEKIVTP